MSDNDPPPGGPQGERTTGSESSANDPPDRLSKLLRWFRTEYTLYVYVDKGQVAPSQFAHGYTEQMVADCLSEHGFRCNQSRVSRMENGEDWPGKTDSGEKVPFLAAATICFALQDKPQWRNSLWLALLFKSGSDGLPEDQVRNAFAVLRRSQEGQES